LSSNAIFTLPAAEYLIDGVDLGAPGYCVFGVSGGLDSSMNMIIFGDVFLRSYYNIYDFENMQVGLALHRYSNADIEVRHHAPPKKSFNYIIVGSIAVIICLVIAGFYLFKRKQAEARRRQEEENLGIALSEGL
jgi:hypothetical protein